MATPYQKNTSTAPHIGELRKEIYIPGPRGPVGPPGPIGPVGMQGPPGILEPTLPHYLKMRSATGQEMNVGELIEFMTIMKERLLILTPNFEKHEKYPALKELYEQYLVVDRLINEDHNPDM